MSRHELDKFIRYRLFLLLQIVTVHDRQGLLHYFGLHATELVMVIADRKTLQ